MWKTVYYRCKRRGNHRGKSLIFLLAVAVTILITGRATADTAGAWSNVAPSGAKFTVLMPGEPEEHTATVPTSVGSTVMHIYLLHDGSKFYSVSYSDYPATPALFDAQAALCGARDGALRKAEGAILSSDVDFTFQGFPAKGMVLQLWGGEYIYRCRMFLVATRLYQTVYAAPPSLAHSTTGGKFLNSFRLVPEPEATSAPLTWLLSPTQTPPTDEASNTQTGSRIKDLPQQKTDHH